MRILYTIWVYNVSTGGNNMPIGENKGGGTWWKVLLGVLGGFFLGVGAVAGAAAIAGTVVKTKTLLGEANAQKYLTATYQEKTILQIVQDAMGGKIKVDTLGDLNNITPMVGEYLTGVRDSLNGIGCELTNEDMYVWKISTLSNDIVGAVKDAKLIRVLSKGNVEYPDPVIKYLSYKTDKGEYVYENGKLVDLKLGQLLDDTGFIQRKVDSMTIKMLFTEGDISGSSLLTAIKDKSVKDLSKKGAFDDVEISAVLSINDSSPQILKTFRDNKTTVGQMGDTINDMKISDVIEINDSSTQILKTFKDKGTKINQMSAAIDDMKLSEVIEINDSSSKILQTLRDKETTIKGLSDTIDDLKVDEVLEIDDSSHQILKTFKDKGTKINQMSEAINDLKLGEVLELSDGDVLYKLRDDNISELKNIDEKLAIEDVFPDRTGMKFISAIPGETKINKIGKAINEMKLVKAFEDNIFTATNEVEATWKYMLAENSTELAAMDAVRKGDNDGNPFKGFGCINYTLGGDGTGADKGINGLVENMKANMQESTLNQLSSNGIITDISPDFLNADVPTIPGKYTPAAGKDKFGKLTIKELSDFIAQVYS